MNQRLKTELHEDGHNNVTAAAGNSCRKQIAAEDGILKLITFTHRLCN